MATSYNGWPASEDPASIGVDPAFTAGGVRFPGGVRGGDVSTVLGYVIGQFWQRVEPPLIDPDTGALGYGCWGYNYRANVNNPSTLSCHGSATAVDISAPAHPNGAAGTFSDAQVGAIYAILDEVQGAVQWGGDYTGTVDEMHFEIIVSAADLAAVAASLPGGDEDMPLTDQDIDKIADRVWNKVFTSRVTGAGVGIADLLLYVDEHTQGSAIGAAAWQHVLTSRLSGAPCSAGDMLTYINEDAAK